MRMAKTKEAASIRGLWHELVAKPIIEANRVVALIRADITVGGLVDQFTETEIQAMLSTESDLAIVAGGLGVTAAADKVVATHRNRARIIPGVND